MNKAITDGLVLMPPPFSAGLNLWSREDGTPGSGSYQAQPNAVLVPSDADFAGCLELTKTASLQKLRSFAQTPMQPGMYLRITARVKAVSGNLPTVRIAGWAGRANGTNVSAVPQTGPEVTLASYGDVATVTAIVGSGNRQGNDMVWGTEPVYGHFGLDLTGPTGGTVRIDDFSIEDVTEVFHRKLIDWVDVRDYGAIGDGLANDFAAFVAADLDAQGRGVLVSKGTYYVGANLQLNSRVRFEGTLSMPQSVRLSCLRNYDLDTYQAAFGSEAEGFRRGLQALFNFTDHVTFDLLGRRVQLTAPVDVAQVAGITSLSTRRVLANGLVEAEDSTSWNTVTVTSLATYTPTTNPLQLTSVANIANVPVGARISGTGVGREIYVRSKNVAAGTIEISRPMWGAAGTRTFTFHRYQYLLDFSGFSDLSRFEVRNVELNCSGKSSGLMLPPQGIAFRFAESVVNRPKDRGITSIGTGCQGLFVDGCQFLSNEQSLPAQDRTTIAVNVNANDSKIRDNRIVRFATFAIMSGGGNIFSGNHFFQGDDQPLGIRRAGIVFASANARSMVVGNYVDNCYLEWTNEHDSAPSFTSGFSFGGLTMTGNIFTVSDVSPAFRFIVITPYGSGQFLNGMTINDNVFRTVNATIDRVEDVDTTFATLDYSRFRNVLMESNTYNGITQQTFSPVMVEHDQATAADTWVVSPGPFLPFGGRARNVQSIVAEGAVTTASNAANSAMPYVLVEQGAGQQQVHLKWPSALKGKVHVTVRVDNPN